MHRIFFFLPSFCLLFLPLLFSAPLAAQESAFEETSSLFFRLNRRGAVGIRHEFLEKPAERCKVEIFARSKQGERIGRIVRVAFRRTRRQRFVLIARGLPHVRWAKGQKGTPAEAHMMARTRCGSEWGRSNVFARCIRCGSEPVVTGLSQRLVSIDTWIRILRQKLRKNPFL